MGKKHRTYTREFKLEVLELHANSGKSMAQIERELDLGSTSISRWKKEFEQEGKKAFPGKGNFTAEQAEIRRLKKELEIVRQERDILKKAVAIFSQAKP